MVDDKKSFADKFSKREAPAMKASSLTEKFAKKSQNTASPETLKKKKDTEPRNPLHELAQFIYLVKGMDNKRKAWYYVLVERLKVSLFLKALKADRINLEEYGKILYSAYGEEPPAEITKKLKKEYGIEDDEDGGDDDDKEEDGNKDGDDKDDTDDTTDDTTSNQ